MSFFSRNSSFEEEVMQRGNENKRRIRPRRTDSPTMTGFLPGMLSRNNTPIVKEEVEDTEAVTTESDTDVYSALSDDDCEVIGAGMTGFNRPRLTRLPARTAIAPPKGPVKRKAPVQIIDIESDSEVEEVVRVAPGRGALVQRYLFTWNNPTIDGQDFKTFLEGKADIKLAVFQLEKGNEETEHFQGYFELNKRMYTTGAHALLMPHRMSLLHAKGTKVQNHTYCTKEGRIDGPWYVKSVTEDYMRKNGNQGKRSDMDQFVELFRSEGGLTEKVRTEMPGHTMAYYRHANTLLAAIKKEELDKLEMEHYIKCAEEIAAGRSMEEIEGQMQRELILLIGPTAMGKTTMVKIEVLGTLREKLYLKPATTKWFDNYEGQKYILIDEYKGGQTIDEFKAISNVGTVLVEAKGTHHILEAKRIYYTTNTHPSRWWKRNQDEYETWSSPDYKAVVRRFAEVRWWNDEGVLTILKNPGPRKETQEWKTSWAAWQKFWEWRDAPGAASANADNYFTL